jgi:hypothetical protein
LELIVNPRIAKLQSLTRRHFLHGSLGLGALALAELGGAARADVTYPADNPLAPRKPHFPGKAKRVIYLHMSGAPPQHDLFDYKPKLVELHMKPCPEELLKGQRFAFIKGRPNLLGSPYKFRRHGKSGAWVSELLPHFGQMVDHVAFLKGMYTDQFNHAPAELLLFTGSPRQGRPSMGTWVTYGLGTENENLPGFVVLISSGVQPSGGQGCWGSGFLPSVYQGVQCRSKGDPVLYVSDPPGMDRDLRRKGLDALKDLNELQAKELGHPETLTRIQQYELAFRMQTSVPEVMDLSKEDKKTIEMYGATPGGASFANNCLLARRLVEKGVRYVQLFDWGWDFHGTGPSEEIKDGLTKKGATMSQPVAALIKDLKQRGLFDSTLIILGGEFGRTPFREGRTAGSALLGRDHYPDVYSLVLAGAGVKGGYTHGESDDLGFSVARDKVHVHDLQATILHLLGFDHTKLTFRFQGRDYRLTDVHGNVVKQLLA